MTTTRRPRQHRFAEPTKDDGRLQQKDPAAKYNPGRPPPEPTLWEVWRRANVYEKAAWVLAAVGSAVLAWLVVRKVP